MTVTQYIIHSLNTLKLIKAAKYSTHDVTNWIVSLACRELHGREKCKWFPANRFFEDHNEEYWLKHDRTACHVEYKRLVCHDQHFVFFHKSGKVWNGDDKLYWGATLLVYDISMACLQDVSHLMLTRMYTCQNSRDFDKKLWRREEKGYVRFQNF